MIAVLQVMVLVLHATIIQSTRTTCREATGHPGCKLLPKDDVCGVTVTLATRIVGGEDANLGQYPWMAILYTRGRGLISKHRYQFICGGSLISDRYVLSAAHCCQPDGGPKLARIRLGEYDLSSSIDCVAGECAPRPINIAVDSYIIHDQYNTTTIENDICLIRLQKPIKFNDYVSPICLPMTEGLSTRRTERSTLEVAGWGVTNQYVDGRTQSLPTLQTLRVPYVPLDRCRVFFPSVTSGKLCAGGVEGEDSCNGDSGGPLMDRYPNQTRQFLAGIVSYGRPICASEVPAVYVDVAKYTTWILDNMRP